jgi:hypothetical protein
MNMIKVIALLAIAFLGYQYWHKHQAMTETVALASDNGFVRLPPLGSGSTRAVVILAAENCPEEGARRADDLAQELDNRSIPYVRAQDAHFDLPGGDQGQEQVERINSIMNGDLPIVFVNGRAKANPTLEEVISEYGGARQ